MRVDVMLTAVNFLFWVGGIVLESHFGKIGNWLAVGAALLLAAALKEWVMR
jgi:hypothetical protein